MPPSYVPGTYPARVIASGASNYWRLGEQSGTVAVDQVGGANGTISGGVTLGQKGALSEPDTAMAFDGLTGQIVTAPALLLPTVATVEMWVRTTVGARPLLVWAGEAPAIQLAANGAIGLYDGAVGVVFGLVPVVDGAWHHGVWVFDGVNATFYVDGVLDWVQPCARLASTQVVAIGRDLAFAPGNISGFYSGSLDDVAIYLRALPAPEILAHYQAKLADMWDPRLYPPTSPPTTGPVAYPAVTSPYPQSGQPSFAPRPAPTLSALAPSSVSVGASDGFLEMTLTGTGFTNASRVSFAGILDHPRVDDTITYVNPTTLLMTLDVRTPPATLPPATYQLGIVNQDSQASATLPLTVSA